VKASCIPVAHRHTQTALVTHDPEQTSGQRFWASWNVDQNFPRVNPSAAASDPRLIAYRIQEEAFGGLDRATVKLLDRLARGEKPELNRRLKAGTVLVREYQGERHTVTVVPDGFVWRDATVARSNRAG
jgi:DUF2924 family protein